MILHDLNNQWIVVLLLTLCSMMVVSQEALIATEKIEDSISASPARSFIHMLGNTTTLGFYSLVRFHYRIHIQNDDPASSPPILLFRHVGQEGIYRTSDNCFGRNNFHDLYDYDPRLIHLVEHRRVPGSNRECVRHTSVNGSILTCTGTLEVAADRVVQWYVSAGFACGHERALMFDYDVTIEAFESVTCKETQRAFHTLERPLHSTLRAFRRTCSELNPFYSTFNINGFSDADFRRAKDIIIWAQNLDCYQHNVLLLCDYFLPSCNDGKVKLPCKESCDSFTNACPAFADTLSCGSLASKENTNCSYLPVQCSEPPELPKNSIEIFANGTEGGSILDLKCIDEYEPEGEAVFMCGLDGTWIHDESFKCVKKHTQQPILKVVIACTCVLIGVIIIFTVIAINYKIELRLLKRKYIKFNGCTGLKANESPKFYHASIAYHQSCDDCETYVKNEIHYKLEPFGYKIYTDYNSTDLGANLVSRIPEVLSQSYRVIIILNQHFLDSDWCKYELEHSFIQLIEDQYFDLLIIVTEDPKTLRNVPRYLRAYLRIKMYLRSSDSGLIEKMRKDMPCCKTAPLANSDDLNGIICSTISEDDIQIAIS